MEEFIVVETKSSPRIAFNPLTHRHEISGESYPENCSKFYGPMFEWLEIYLGNVSSVRLELSIDILIAQAQKFLWICLIFLMMPHR